MQRESITSAFGLKRPITMTEYIKMQINRGLATPTTLFAVCMLTNYQLHFPSCETLPYSSLSLFYVFVIVSFEKGSFNFNE